MTNIEFCLSCRKSERKAFVNVMKAMPQDQLGYRPHPKSRSAAELAWVLAAEEADIAEILRTGAVEWKPQDPPASVDQIVAAYERNAEQTDALLAKTTEEIWHRRAKFLVDGKAAWEDTTANMVWGMLFDGIHHRGQLSVYLRPMGGKVPSIYGPSGDDPGQ